MTILADNLKLRLDPHQGRVAHAADTSPSLADAAQMDDAEAQMRRALGLQGDMPRHRPEPERLELPQRPAERYAPGGHRRRFVQDGDVPVTIVRRDGSTTDPLTHRPAAVAPPTTSRLQRVESALAAETAARDRAERALAEAQAAIRDLQTKIGHAELARNEAVETLRREREAAAAARSEAEEHVRLLDEAAARAQAAEDELAAMQATLAEERAARKAAEKAQRIAEQARDSAEALLQEFSEAAEPVEPAVPVEPRQQPQRRAAAKPEVAAKPRRSRMAPAMTEAEPEPVKWWLMSAPKAKRR